MRKFSFPYSISGHKHAFAPFAGEGYGGSVRSAGGKKDTTINV